MYYSRSFPVTITVCALALMITAAFLLCLRIRAYREAQAADARFAALRAQSHQQMMHHQQRMLDLQYQQMRDMQAWANESRRRTFESMEQSQARARQFQSTLPRPPMPW